jgi:predicted nucleic acid-binding protein
VAAHLFDSSGIVKRYVNELGTGWVCGIVDPAARNAIYLVRISAVEVVSAVTRRQRGGSLSAALAARILTDFRFDLANQYQVVAVTPRLITSAMSWAEKYALRGYDAVQLAAALQVNGARRTRGASALTLVSADADLNAAAVAEGLPVEDPNTHP